MPMDGKGRYHMNPAHAKMADKEQAKPSAKAPTTPEPPIEDGGMHTTLHDHGDGTFHTEGNDGDVQEHPSLDHALQHMQMKHGGGQMAEPMSNGAQPAMCGGY